MLRILKNQAQVDDARLKLRERGCDTSVGASRRLFQFLYLLRFRRAAPDVAINKSWDVYSILDAVEEYAPDRKAKIFDMGSYNCEIPVALWRRGYHNIRASDLNPLGRCINWYGNRIDFHCEDFYSPDLEEESLDIITSLSVIEHGFSQENLLKVCQKYLKKGGLCFLTTDYHKEKIEIDKDFRLFNLSYMIFSQEEIKSFIDQAKNYNLELIGSEEWTDSDYPIEFLDNKMTFILMAFKKV